MFPLRDDQPRTTIPYVTYSIITINLAVFAYEVWLGLQDPKAWYAFLMRYAEVPHHFQLAFQGAPGYTVGGAFLTIFTSMFLHAGWLHVLGNMWFLWIFGDNIEDHLGHVPYILFYLFCGFIGSMAELLANPTSDVPGLGASGAVAGVMGAYLLRYPQARIQVVWGWFGFRIFWMRAIGMLFYWFALQIVGQILAQTTSSGMGANSGGVAYLAHLGGFATGLVMIKVIPGRSEYAYGSWTKRDNRTSPSGPADSSASP